MLARQGVCRHGTREQECSPEPWDPSSLHSLSTWQMHQSLSVALALKTPPVPGQLDNINFLWAVGTVQDIPAAFPFPGRGETRPWAIPVGQHSWKRQLDGLETCKITNFPSSVQLSSLAQTGWCCQSCWAYPLLRLLLHKITALLCWQMEFSLDAFLWLSCRVLIVLYLRMGLQPLHFFLPYLLKQICDVSTAEVWTWTRVSYVYLE